MLTTALPLLIALSGTIQDAPAREPEARREVRFVFAGPGGGRHMDKDGDGFVSREEFTAPMADAFGKLDANSDGRISTEEFAARRGEDGEPDVMMLRHGGPARHIFVRRLGGPDGERRDMDANKDGRVTEEEFIAPLRDAFKRMDRNGNGVLDEDERGDERVRIIERTEEVRRERGA